MNLFALLVCLSCWQPIDSTQVTASYTLSIEAMKQKAKAEIAKKKADIETAVSNASMKNPVSSSVSQNQEAVLEKAYQSSPIKISHLLDSVSQTQSISPELQHVSDSYKKMVGNDLQYNGYTIQLYAGTKQKALNYRSQFVMSFPSKEVFISYENLNYVVQFGKYLNRMNANKDLKAIQEKFKHAYLVRAKIPYIVED